MTERHIINTELVGVYSMKSYEPSPGAIAFDPG